MPAPPLELCSGDVRLRPYVPADIELLLAAGVHGDVPPFGGGPEERRRRAERRVERSGRLVAGRLDLAIVRGGRLVGGVEARQPPEGLPPGTFEVGIALFAERDRGAGVGTVALRLFTDHLFADPSIYRVQGATWVENRAMRRVFEKLGWTFEGVMRAFMPTPGGGRHDYALYAVTRADRADGGT